MVGCLDLNMDYMFSKCISPFIGLSDDTTLNALAGMDKKRDRSTE